MVLFLTIIHVNQTEMNTTAYRYHDSDANVPLSQNDLTSVDDVYLPKAELIAEHSGVSVAEIIGTNSPPAAIATVVNFQASFMCHITSDQSH